MKVKWKEEALKIKELAESGKTLQEIGDLYGVSREYIRQVLNRYFPALSRKERGIGKRKTLKIEARVRELQTKFNRDTYVGISDLDSRQSLFFTRKRQNNKTRGKWEWDIVMSDLEWPSHCPILGMELDWFAESRQENSPSIDRIDSTKGYVPGNVMICSWRANRIKNDGTYEEHKKIADFLEGVEILKKSISIS